MYPHADIADGPRPRYRRQPGTGSERHGVGGGDEARDHVLGAGLVEVDGEKSAGVVEQQRIDTSDEIASAIAPDTILATQMGFNHLVADRNERLVRALAATNLGLAANTPHPLVRASWRIAAAAGFRILPSCGEHIRAAGEQSSEERDLVGRRRAVGHGCRE